MAHRGFRVEVMFVKTPGHQVQNSLQGSFAILGILNPKPT